MFETIRADAITVRHALSHNSGLSNWRIVDLPLKTYFPPGERFSYSGEGFVWLQRVVEAITGDPIDALLHRLVFEPLEMRRSSFVWQSTFDANYADPHDAALVPDLKKKPATANTAASLQTTARDYARFLQAVLSGARLKPETARLWLSPQVTCLTSNMPESDTQVAWELGWGLEPRSGTFFQWGDNDRGRFEAFPMGLLQGRSAVVVFTNSFNGMPALMHRRPSCPAAPAVARFSCSFAPRIYSRDMMRRTFLKVSGATGIALGGAFAWWAQREGVFSVGEGPAFEPWQNWRSGEWPLALVRAAILAANPHNTQPWLFKVGDARIDIYADTARNLGAFDPYLREMYIGLGCAIENIVLAAAALGYDAQVVVVDGLLDPIPQPPHPTHVATIELSAGAPRQDELYVAIPRRHTNRAAYSPRQAVPLELLQSLQSITEDSAALKVILFSTESERKRLGEMMITATATIIADKTMINDSQRWFRSRWVDVQKFRDGPTLDTSGLSPLMVSLAKLAPEPSPKTSHRYWLAATRDVQVPSAPVLGLIAVESLYDRRQAIRAGRAWQRMHLFATTHGLAMQPINQPVELVDRERQLAREPLAARALETIVGDHKWKPTFAFRLGFPTRDVPPSPRRPVGDVVM